MFSMGYVIFGGRTYNKGTAGMIAVLDIILELFLFYALATGGK